MATNTEPDAFDISAGVPEIDGALRPTPKYADRISKRVLAVAFLVVGVIVAIFLLSLDNMDKKKQVPEKEVTKKEGNKDAELRGSDDLLGVGEKLGLGSSLVKPPLVIAQEALLTGKPPLKTGSGAGDIPIYEPIPKDVVVPPLTPEQLAANLEKQARIARMAQARLNGLSAKSFEDEGAAASGVNSKISELLAAAKNAGMAGAGSGQVSAASKSDGDQDEKLDFLKNASKDERGYHPHVAMAALSLNEVKTGSFIPMALEQGINSDLPGQITARVTESVYDTISGCRLLIPAMSKVVGKYDSKVALGQGRMLVVWNSLIFPDGAELNLAGMQGYDTGGQAGLESDVDNHYFRMFGLAFGMSMVTAGVQLSVPQPNPGANGAAAAVTPAQTVAAALAQQYGQLGAQILSKYMAVQPTLRNFAGERFVVMVPRTIVFNKVWRNRCMAR